MFQNTCLFCYTGKRNHICIEKTLCRGQNSIKLVLEEYSSIWCEYVVVPIQKKEIYRFNLMFTPIELKTMEWP